ncbi:unnamed protein product [Periconia digitata]|uniref:Uncharacterized protein n=1 Tax=Periconia digitata TaxID=1303443 RepID=A0A9W4ULH1_9PLEO|nr:unnamed protein product [Periconia digitata]
MSVCTLHTTQTLRCTQLRMHTCSSMHGLQSLHGYLLTCMRYLAVSWPPLSLPHGRILDSIPIAPSLSPRSRPLPRCNNHNHLSIQNNQTHHSFIHSISRSINQSSVAPESDVSFGPFGVGAVRRLGTWSSVNE